MSAKKKGIRLFLISAVATALVFCGIQFIQAQQIKTMVKPPKAPKYTWEMTIVPGGCLWGIPDERNDGNGWVYKDSEPNVVVANYVLTYIRKPNIRSYTPIFRVEVFPGAQIWFNDIPIIDETRGGEFPDYTQGFGDYVNGLFEFLQFNPHPADGYTKLLFFFNGYASPDKESADFLNMEINDTKLIHMDLWIIGQGLLSDTDYCNLDDHNTIMADAFGYYPDDGPVLPDLYVVREGLDTWRVVVDTKFDNPKYEGDDYSNVWEYHQGRIFQEYCKYEEVPFNKKKDILKRQTYRPFWARAHMKFEMRFTRKVME